MHTTPRKKASRIIVIVILLVAIFVTLVFVAKPLYEDYLATRRPVDLYEHFGLTDATDVPLYIGDTLTEDSAKIFSGVLYWDSSNIEKVFDERFYFHQEDGYLLFTTADEVVRVNLGESFYTTHAEVLPVVEPAKVDMGHTIFRKESGKMYLSLEFLKNYANFTYTMFRDPNRIQMYTEDYEYSSATLVKRGVLHEATERKSGMLKPFTIGETVYIEELLGDWTKVRTQDALVGFVESSRLSAPKDGVITIPVSFVDPPYTDVVRDHQIVLGWNQLTNPDANNYLADYLEGAYPMNVISPTWYRITDGQGGMQSFSSKAYVDQAHARGLEVWPLLDDFTSGLDRSTLLSSIESRRNVIAFMISECEGLGLDGINLDFELIPDDSGPHFTQFIREFSVAMRARGLVFSIDNYPPRDHTFHYNRRVQGMIVDYVIIMGYDEHWSSSSGAGSVASISYVREAIELTLEQSVPARKTINAVPFYTRIWSTAHSDGTVRAEAVGQKTQAQWIANRGLEPIWSEELGQNYTQIDENNRTYQIWLEDADSMRVRLAMMKEFDLAGIACWRLGLENAALWNEIANYIAG